MATAQSRGTPEQVQAVIAGRHDWITPPTQGAERLHAELPNSKLVIFEESGHFPFIEEHDKFVTTVQDWIRSLG